MPSKEEVVYYNLATSDLHDGADILHIAAVSRGDGEAFSVYVRPRSWTIHPGASAENGITFDRRSSTVLQNGVPVAEKPVCLTKAVLEFSQYLRRHSGCLLVADAFHHRFLCAAFQKARVPWRLTNSVLGMADSQPLLRQFGRARADGGVRKSVALRALAEELLGLTDLDASDKKASALMGVMRKLNIPLSAVQESGVGVFFFRRTFRR